MRPVVTESTSKIYKGIMVVGLLAIIGPCVTPGMGVELASGAFAIGAILIIAGAAGAWWDHA
jgi:hypothetical protein